MYVVEWLTSHSKINATFSSPAEAFNAFRLKFLYPERITRSGMQIFNEDRLIAVIKHTDDVEEKHIRYLVETGYIYESSNLQLVLHLTVNAAKEYCYGLRHYGEYFIYRLDIEANTINCILAAGSKVDGSLPRNCKWSTV